MIVWILEHHYALAGLAVAAFITGVAVAGLCVVAGESEERRAYRVGGDGLERDTDDNRGVSWRRTPRSASRPGAAVAADTSREWMVARSGPDEAA